MGNVIQIKHGSGVPNGKLQPYELGFDEAGKKLYIGDVLNNGALGNAIPIAPTLSDLGITATVAELNKMDGVTATTAELNVLKGITATTTELNYCVGVKDNIQTQLDGKQASITGGASTVTGSNLTASHALVSNASGKIAISNITSTELGYLGGVTSAIQTQLNNKVPTTRTINSKALSSNISLTAADVGALPQKCAYYNNTSTANADTCNDPFALFHSNLVGSTLKNLLGNPDYIYIFTFYYANSNQKLQIAFPYNLASSAVAVRQSYSGTWKAWTRIDNHAPLTGDQYGTTLPDTGVKGQIFFMKVT